MSETDDSLSTLRRKAGARPGPAPPPRGMSPEKALLQALTKSGEALNGLELVVRDQQSSLCDQTELLAQMPDVALFTLADGPGDARGLICFGGELVDALIEVQTMGRVDRASRAPRPTTRIDAALTRDFVETVLNDFGARVAQVTSARWARGFKYGTYVPDPTPLGLMLPEGDYRLQALEVDLGSGAKQAKVWLALPAIAQHPGTPPAPAMATNGTTTKTNTPTDPVWTEKMKAVTALAPVELNAILARMKVPLFKMQSLEVGDCLPISRSALSQLELQGAGPGQTLSARLGQQNGMRAVRLSLTGPAAEGKATTISGVAKPNPSQTSAPPDLPDLPDLPDANGLPDLPPIGGMQDGLPDLPNLPPLGGMDDGLPDLPPLPDLPDLPPLE